MIHDQRFGIHPVSVQQIPASYQLPKKRLSHTSKPHASAGSGGTKTPIPRRAGITAGFLLAVHGR